MENNMIEINKEYIITAFNQEEDLYITKHFNNPVWMGAVGLKLYPRAYSVPVNKENDKIVKKMIEDKKGEIK
jgi:hypothetical protein